MAQSHAEAAMDWVRHSKFGTGRRRVMMIVIAHGATLDLETVGLDHPAGVAVCCDTPEELAEYASLPVQFIHREVKVLEDAGAVYASSPYLPGAFWINYSRPSILIEPPLRKNRPARPLIPEEIRRAIYIRDGYSCVTCQTSVDLTLDHIVPWSLGGADDVTNLRTMCRSCNSRKGAR